MAKKAGTSRKAGRPTASSAKQRPAAARSPADIKKAHDRSMGAVKKAQKNLDLKLHQHKQIMTAMYFNAG